MAMFLPRTLTMKKGALKRLLYVAVMGNFFSGPYSILAKVTATLQKPASELLPIVLSIYSGIQFLSANPNPHYAIFLIDGGVNYMRSQLVGQQGDTGRTDLIT